MQILNPSRWYLHPVFIFACSIFALATFLVLTVSLYMEIRSALEIVMLKFNIEPQAIFPSKTGMTILVLSLLIFVVLAGIFLAFIYYQKTVNLFRLQHNFIYNFTHELKTPVTSLRLYLETFIRHPMDPEDVKKYSADMLKDIDRLTENIDRILNLARIESQNFGSKVTRENLVVFLKTFCRKNASLFRGLDVRIKNPSGGRFEYPVNAFLLDILLTNIFSNAIRYNESRTPCLTILFKSYLQKVTIDFIDNGIGVDKEDAKKIFRKFYQGDRNNNQTNTGSGLGLYLVSSIAAIHGWRASVSSEGTGKGAKFTITIPRASIASVRDKELWKRLKKNVF
ncbi:MAG TPA: HAMP domain-containing sensor histidine kinase [Desulfobacter postgatei]|jgi:signal transduction histidine kinase|uniref:sensor histidine kinase n=1 Tax=Desulfobacter sp. TaxID=2294 RepID=UPI000E8D511D|nr:HAMP domain-containing sensor histidine kinase [Desulfobacter sp.]MDQ1269939.1 two-component system, OmpR family, phosphate regulon sensor histidine kinase PhoR [Thermodesulfobacteriota bacterium]HRF90521.1 HAMP domain-containing sensor histidine kinase [Desulfobacter postgatei]MBP8830576.1 HAMP domain-containing histidine kinase [Desulfobacter sp.]MBP9599662.1 HAMP domain-containing histidine kinase [Desulfobacter sp.]HBT86953.1 sensor histidine kinase [Desulfobacter sp.]